MAHTLTKWNRMGDLNHLRAQFDRMFDDLGSALNGTLAPAVDVIRDGDKLIVRAELPGIKLEEVTIEVEGDVLTVSARHEEGEDEKDDAGRYLRRERRLGAFARSIPLPKGVDPNAITAEVGDGIVEVTVPLPADQAGHKVRITPTRAAADHASPDGSPDAG